MQIVKELKNGAGLNYRVEKELELEVMGLTVEEKRVVVDLLNDIKIAFEGSNSSRGIVAKQTK